MVETLTSWLKIWLQDAEHCEKFTKIVNLQDITSHCPTPIPQTDTFFLMLTSCISSDKSTDMILDLYKKIVRERWTDSGVMNAWLQGVNNMLQSEDIQSVLKWIHAEELHHIIISCLKQPSLYVKKSTVELYSTMIYRSVSSCSDMVLGDNHLVKSFSELWLSGSGGDEEIRLRLLQILNNALCKSQVDCWAKLCTQFSIFNKLYCSLETCDDGKHAERNQVIELLSKCVSYLTKDEVSKLEGLVVSKLDAGHIQTSMVLAQWLVLNCKERLRCKKRLGEIQLLVLYSVSTRHQIILEDDPNLQLHVHNKLLDNTTNFPELFLRQLELLESWCKHERLDSEVVHLLIVVYQGLQDSSGSSNRLMTRLYSRRQKLLISLLHTINTVFSGNTDATSEMCSFALCCADHLTQATSCVMVQKSLEALFTCLVNLHKTLRSSEHSGSMTSPSSALTSSTLGHVWGTVGVMLQQLLCHLTWEIIDCSVEFFTKLLHHVRDGIDLHKETDTITDRVVQLVNHSESYLRASAVTCLAAIASVPHMWTRLTTQYTPDEILKNVLSVTSDQEAFPRRAAIKAISSLYQLNLYPAKSSYILNIISKATHDLDWEVKVSVLEFWENYIDDLHSSNEPVPEYAVSVVMENSKSLDESQQLDQLLQSGCLQSLLVAVHDCDKTVQKKACLILGTVKQRYNQSLKIDSEPNQLNSPEIGIKKEVIDVNLSALLEISNQSTDQYDINPEFLLDDILRSVQCVDQHNSEDEDNAIDCY